MGSPALFSGSFVKLLKSQLNLADQAYIIPGPLDPTVTPVNAPASSLYLRSNPSVSTSYGFAASGGGSAPSNGGKYAEVFTASASGTITSAGWYVYNSSGTALSGNVFMKIYSTVGGVPSTLLYTSAPVAASTLLTGSGNPIVPFTFTGATLTNGVTYAAVIDFSAPTPAGNVGIGTATLPGGYTTWYNGPAGGTGDSYQTYPGGFGFSVVTTLAGTGSTVYVKQDSGSSTNWLLLDNTLDVKAVEIEAAYRDKHEDSPYQLMTLDIFAQRGASLVSSFFGATPASYVGSSGTVNMTAASTTASLTSALATASTTSLVNSNTYQGNTFTTPAGTGISLNSISAALNANGNTATNAVVIKVWATSAHTPTTLVGTSNSRPLNTLTGTSVAFTFLTALALQPATQYAWTMEIDGLSPNPIAAPFPTYNVATAGITTEYFVSSLNAGSTWTSSNTTNVATWAANYNTIADGFQTTNLLDPVEFLANPNNILTDITSIDLLATWLTGSIDTAGLYQVSRDGGTNWSTISMVNAGAATDTFYGSLTFGTEPVSQTIFTNVNGNTGSFQLNTTTQQAIGQKFTLTNATTIQSVQILPVKIGAIAGNIYAAIYSDSSGLPSLTGLLTSSAAIPVANLVTATPYTIVFANTPLPAGTYHIVFSSDATFKASWSSGTNLLNLENVSVSTGPEAFNGTAWTANGYDGIQTVIAGRALDVRVRIAAGTANVKLSGLALSYSPVNTNATTSAPAVQFFQFNSTTQNLNTFTVSAFKLDQNLVSVDYVEAGLHFVAPSFSLQGQTVVFPTNFFNPDGVSRTVTLKISQFTGASYNTTDQTNLLLAANHLGSTDSTIDRSVVGRGIILRRPDGTLREIALNNSDQITISSVP